jgi:DNA (cytosine-5)-methyltransferase 1
MNVLSLFSGIGGLELGLERAGMTVVGQVEINPFCRSVLEKHWPGVPRHDDVRTTVDWWRSEQRPAVDVICGGFPCQDISHAGKREGITGPKSSLWGAMLNTVCHLRPRYVLVENVAALAVRGLDTVLADLASSGFDAEWTTLRASDFGAPHNRERIYLLAYPQSIDRQSRDLLEPSRIRPSPFPTGGLPSVGASTRRRTADQWLEGQPRVARLVDGLPHQVDRITALGNAVVPQVSQFIGEQLMAQLSSEVA